MKEWRRGVSLQEMPALAWRIQQEAERLTGVAASTFYDEIGTLYQFFGQPEAAAWFRKAIEGYRANAGSGTDQGASIKAALVLWKAGHKEECEAECLQLLRMHSPTLETDALTARNAVIALGQIQMASFILGRYPEAIAAADRRIALCERESARQGHAAQDPMAMAIREMSAGVIEGDRLRFEHGLDRLTTRIDRWPTSASSLEEDLFRYGLSLPICDAEAFIRWKMKEESSGIH